jgi:hypothetical protein
MVNLSLLDTNPLVIRYDVSEFRPLENGVYYRCEIVWKDGSRLFAREYSSDEKRVYSFHWQDTSDCLRLRWDNAPHFPLLPTFPHHRHNEDGTVSESQSVSFEDVMADITQRLNP